MAIDAYMQFMPYKTGDWLPAESQVDLGKNTEPLGKDFTAGKVFEILDYSFGVQQTLNIGSQSSGSGAGKVTFNPFTIRRKIDLLSPTFYQMACAGTAFQRVILGLRKSTGADASGQFFLRYDFKLVAVSNISWAHNDEGPEESITLEYGGLIVNYNKQNPDGTLNTTLYQAGWNRVKNIADVDPTTAIASS